MKRSRTVNASPARSTTEAVEAIESLIRGTLKQSGNIPTDEVDGALIAARSVSLMLVSARHTVSKPIVLVAGQTICEIYTRYGAEALTAEENLRPVPGVGDADTFTIHLPAPAPLTATVEQAAGSDPHLSAEAAPTDAPATQAAGRSLVNFDALRGNRQ